MPKVAFRKASLLDAFCCFILLVGWRDVRGDQTVVSWGSQGDIHASSIQLELSGEIQGVVASPHAFAVIKANGNVSTWGRKRSGGDSFRVQKDLAQIASISHTDHAFAALSTSGKLVTWGDANTGGDSSLVVAENEIITTINSTSYQFAAANSTFHLKTWGSSPLPDTREPPSDRGQGISRIYANAGAFVAVLRDDAHAIAWGAKNWGGEPDQQVEQLLNQFEFKYFVATEAAFAGVPTQNNNVVTWGGSEWDATKGFTGNIVVGLYTPKLIATTSGAFAALQQSKEVKAWGDPWKGGDASSVQTKLRDIMHISSTDGAFAARDSKGAVFTWGMPEAGGDSSSVQQHLTEGVNDVYNTGYAFAAVKIISNANTTAKTSVVIAWGHPERGGLLPNDLPMVWEGEVKKIVGTARAFAALVDKGNNVHEVVTWGDPSYGADSSLIAQTLNKRVKDVFGSRHGKAFAASVCIPGVTDEKCKPCGFGEYFNKTNVKCMQCAENQKPTANLDACEYCPAGQYKTVANNSIECSACQSDEYSGENAKGICKKCDASKGFITNYARDNCTECEYGTVASLNGECLQCSDGTIPDKQIRFACTPCPQTSYAKSGDTECKECESYEYVNSRGDGCNFSLTILTPIICGVSLLVLLCGYKSRYGVKRYLAMSKMRKVLLHSQYDIAELQSALRQAQLANIKKGNQNLATIQKSFTSSTHEGGYSRIGEFSRSLAGGALLRATTRGDRSQVTLAGKSEVTGSTRTGSRRPTRHSARTRKSKTDQSFFADADSEHRPVIRFLPGDHGMEIDDITGRVVRLKNKGYAQTVGVKVGWRIVKVADEEYTKQVLDDYTQGDPYELTFAIKVYTFQRAHLSIFDKNELSIQYPDWSFATLLRTSDNLQAAGNALTTNDIANLYNAYLTQTHKLVHRTDWQVVANEDEPREATCTLLMKEVQKSRVKRVIMEWRARFRRTVCKVCNMQARFQRCNDRATLFADCCIEILKLIEWKFQRCVYGEESDVFMEIPLYQLQGTELMALVERQFLSQKNKYTSLDALIDIVGENDLSLIRGKWFLNDTDHQYSHPRFKRKQDLPELAFWTKESLQFQERFITVVAVSYCWCHPNHCDPKGKHFKIIRHAVDLRLKAKGRALKQDLALFFDYMSITQDEEDTENGKLVMNPKKGKKRNKDDYESFKKGLMAVNIPYGNQLVESWILNWVPDGIDYKYDQRAWPTFEKAVSSLIKDVSNLIMLTDKILNATDAEELLKTMKSSRSAPCTPPRFSDVIQRKKVTSGRDIKMLEKKYKETFSEVIGQAKSLWFTDLDWSDFEASQLVELFDFLSREKRQYLETVILQRNKFSALAALGLIKVAGRCTSLSTLDLSDNFIKDDPNIHKKLMDAWEFEGKEKKGLRLDSKRKEMKKDFAHRHKRSSAVDDVIPDAVEEKPQHDRGSPDETVLHMGVDEESDDEPDRPPPELLDTAPHVIGTPALASESPRNQDVTDIDEQSDDSNWG